MRLFYRSISLLSTILIVGCSGAGGTVLEDFGIKERPEGYVSGSDKVMANMKAIGNAELKRLNASNRHGEIQYDDSDSLRGKFYKEVRVYTRAYPLDAQPTGRRGNSRQRGFTGLIEYAYEFKESRRFDNRAEAAAANAEIPGRKRGRERFRYNFNSAGAWDGARGDSAN